MAQNKQRLDSLQKALSAGQPPPTLVVLRHDSPCEEKFTRNGIGTFRCPLDLKEDD
jgi:hypothetical protein